MVLDASGNGMGGTEIKPLLDLYRLETLNLADNDIEEMAQVRQIVTSTEGASLSVPVQISKLDITTSHQLLSSFAGVKWVTMEQL